MSPTKALPGSMELSPAHAVLDRSLVERASEGHSQSWEALVRIALPVVHRWCARLGGPRVDASDAAQDVFVVVFTRLDALGDPDHFMAWLYGITRRVLAQHRRKAWIRRWVPGLDLGGHVVESAAPEARDPLLDNEQARAVQAILERLPEAQREALVLCDGEGRTAREVGALLGIPQATVQSRLRLARVRFRRLAPLHGLQLPDVVAEQDRTSTQEELP